MAKIKQSGIYRITNAVTGMSYIGSSTSLRDRWLEHRRRLRRNVHENSHLQRAWNKYGESNFSFNIIEWIVTEQLLDREKFWLSRVSPLYNFDLVPISNAVRGSKRPPFSIEYRQKLSNAHKGKPKPKPDGFSETVKQAWKHRSRNLSLEVREHRAAARRGKKRPSSFVSSMTGRKLMTNGLVNRLTKLEDVPQSLQTGWRFGRHD